MVFETLHTFYADVHHMQSNYAWITLRVLSLAKV